MRIQHSGKERCAGTKHARYDIKVFHLTPRVEFRIGRTVEVTFSGIERQLIFKWVDIDQLEEIRLYPLFLRKSLLDIKPYLEHIINHDD